MDREHEISVQVEINLDLLRLNTRSTLIMKWLGLDTCTLSEHQS